MLYFLIQRHNCFILIYNKCETNYILSRITLYERDYSTFRDTNHMIIQVTKRNEFIFFRNCFVICARINVPNPIKLYCTDAVHVSC